MLLIKNYKTGILQGKDVFVCFNSSSELVKKVDGLALFWGEGGDFLFKSILPCFDMLLLTRTRMIKLKPRRAAAVVKFLKNLYHQQIDSGKGPT